MGPLNDVDRPGRDPGLQPERTRLAWRRTTLACTVAALLAGKAALSGGPGLAGLLACALCLIVWLAFLTAAHHRIRVLTTAAPRPLAPRFTAALALCTVVLAVCGVVVVV